MTTVDGTDGCMEDVVGTTAEGRKADGGDGSSMGDVVGMRVGRCEDDSSADCDREVTSMLRLLHVPLRAGRQFRHHLPIFWQEQPLHRPLPLHLQQAAATAKKVEEAADMAMQTVATAGEGVRTLICLSHQNRIIAHIIDALPLLSMLTLRS